MTKKWRPNDIKIAKLLRKHFSDDDIDNIFNNAMERGDYPEEWVEFEIKINPLLYTACQVKSSAFSSCEDFLPDVWNPYPEILPPEEGEYLITVKIGERSEVRIGRWGLVGGDSEWVGEIQAQIQGFKELPEPYKRKSRHG